MKDVVDELMQHCKERGLKRTRMMSRVHRFHKTNPQVLDFLVQELREVRESGWVKTSLGNLWHHARWVLTQKLRAPGETFVMSNNFFPHYARLIIILHPEFNGFYEMARAKADSDFGTMLERTAKAKPGHVRRLLWSEGTAIENGWKPSTPHEPKPVARRERVRRKPPLSVRLEDVEVGRRG